MARKEKRYFYIYKTTNLLNGKYYYGMHMTNDLDDGYYGSGDRLKRSINKHGKENHRVDILEFLPDRISLINREKEIVTLNEIAKEDCMNLKVGGDGGFSVEEAKNGRKKTDAILTEKYGENFRKIISDNYHKSLNENDKIILRNKIIEGHKKSGFNHITFKDKKHSNDSIVKMRLSHKGMNVGEKNSQFGTCWINNGIKNKKIKKCDILPNDWIYGRINVFKNISSELWVCKVS